MKAIKYTLFISIAVVMHSLPFGEGWGGVYAQKVLKDTMLHVVKSFQPTIADAYKMNEMPVVKDSVPPIPQLSYSINPKKINTAFVVEPLKPAKMQGEPLTKLYNSLVKVGAGNYNTPYAEIFYNNLRSKEMSYGTHLKHLSSQSTLDGGGYSGFSDNEIGLYGKKFLRKHTVTANLDYTRSVVHYYGYNTSLNTVIDNDIIKQIYGKIGGDVSLQSHFTDSVQPNYLFNLKYYNLSDNYNTSENYVNATGEASAYYEKQLIHVPLNIDYYNNQSYKDTGYTTIVTLAPYMLSSGEKWNTRIGIGLTTDAEKDQKTRFLFYPNIDFNYNVLENIIVPYAGISGGLKKNSLLSLTGENPFLIPGPSLKNTNEKWQVYAGVKGSISKNVSYNARTYYSKLENMYFFINDDHDIFRKGFNTLYDDATLWNVHGELQFQYNEKIKVLAKGDYNKYSMTYEASPWMRPLWQTTFSANYNLKNKIIVIADIFVYGKRDAKIYATDPLDPNVSVSTSIELKTLFDANLGLEYRYSKKLSGFINFNNLGFSRYGLYNNYNTQRFNFLLGVSMAF